jgi:hypothetical protein
MSHKTAATVAHTIGIDTGKNTLYEKTVPTIAAPAQ